MIKAPVFDEKGSRKGELNLKEGIFSVEPKENLVHLVCRAYLASQRAGSANTRGRSEVRGGGAKPWRQKGTGRARVGTIRSPLWKGGGVTFGPKPRDYSFKVNKKEKKLALKSVLSAKAREKKVLILDKLTISEPSTKKAFELLSKLKIDKNKVTLVLSPEEEKVYLSFRNLPFVNVVLVSGINVYLALNNEYLLFTKAALECLNEVLD